MLAAMHYDPFDPVMRRDPHPVYARLRRESPVHYCERWDSWALALFEDVWNAGQDNEHFEQPGPSLMILGEHEELEGVMTTDASGSAESVSDRGTIFMMNPPQHTALRKALARLFTPKAVSHLEQRLRVRVRELLAEALPTGRMDAIGDYAGHISVSVACAIIGLPAEDGPMLSDIVTRYFSREPGVEGMSETAIAAMLELRAYLRDAVTARRRAGVGSATDALGVYLGLEIDGRPFDDDELVGQMVTLVVGGTETLPKVFAGGVLQLARHPDQRAALVADPTRLRDAFEEIARYEMPTQFLTRRVKRDLELRGQKLRAGQGVLLLYRSANRDEREFADPDRFDIARRPSRILSFGHGTHVCLGQHAARLEARIMYEELLAAVPEYDVPEDGIVRAHSEFVDGYLSLPMVFEPRELD
jgi:cytochrome P450